MLAHVSLGTHDLARAKEFYDAVLAELDEKLLMGSVEEQFLIYGKSECFFIVNTPLNEDKSLSLTGNGSHIAFKAKSPDQVDNFYKKAIELGAKCSGKPGLRPEYNDDYYAAFVYDLDGHKIEAMLRLSWEKNNETQ